MARYNVREGWMSEELKRERETSSLNLEELTNFLDGNETMTERRRKIYEEVFRDPVFKTTDRYFYDREKAFDVATEKAVKYIQTSRRLNITQTDERYYFRIAMDEELPTSLNETMFIPSIASQGTEEQQKRWVPAAKNYKIIGAYAQTELGHGTYLRGLETTATYDHQTQEFVIHSPTLTSTKWWPGSLGHVATHAIVPARLITMGTDHGMHLFVVQLRSLKDHTPLPDIEVGDIGPKFGYFGMDNGYLRLNKVRIPRDHMLMKYSQVAPDGTYTKPPTAKMSYGTMVQVRTGLVMFLAHAISRAVTIAVRYSVVRRQGEMEPGAGEVQVMDYQTQQQKLLPLVAAAYALIQTGIAMMIMFVRVRGQMAEGNMELLPELHATSAGLKAITAEIANEGIEVCRMACGGHGYSLASGLPSIYVNYVPANTYEGENTVMFLQTSRYLNKLYSSRLPSSDLPGNVSYLAADYPVHASCGLETATQLSDTHTQLELYRQRARRMVGVANSSYQRCVSSGMSQAQAWNATTVDWTVAAKAHCYYVVLKSFSEAIETNGLSLPNERIMRMLCTLFAVNGIVQKSGEFMSDGYMSSFQVSLARQLLYSLLHDLRPEAVPLVDAFDIPDQILNSALGRYDGDVYRHMYEWARQAPRNKSKVHDIYHKHLKKLLHSKL